MDPWMFCFSYEKCNLEKKQCYTWWSIFALTIFHSLPYSAAGIYEEAIKYHKQELTISKEVNDRTSEAATHGNLAVAFQALGKHEMALVHYHSHLNIARELKDVAGEL